MFHASRFKSVGLSLSFVALAVTFDQPEVQAATRCVRNLEVQQDSTARPLNLIYYEGQPDNYVDVRYLKTTGQNFLWQETNYFKLGRFIVRTIINRDNAIPDKRLRLDQEGAFLERAQVDGKKYIELLLNQTAFARHLYDQNRDFSEEFKATLPAKAIKNNCSSDIVLISTEDGSVVGSMRVTKAPYQVLINRKTGEVVKAMSFGNFPREGDLAEWIKNAEAFPILPAEDEINEVLDRPASLIIKREYWEPIAAAKYKGSEAQRKKFLVELENYDLGVGIKVELASFGVDYGSVTPDEAKVISATLIHSMANILQAPRLNWGISYSDSLAGGYAGTGISVPIIAKRTDQIFLTYGDLLSVRKYRPMGYTSEKRENWYKLTSTGQSFVTALGHLAEKLKVSPGDIQFTLDNFTRGLNFRDFNPQFVPPSDCRRDVHP